MPSDDADVPTPNCPVCGAEPSEVSWQTAPGQAVCTNDCPVNTWNRDEEYEPDVSPSGWFERHEIVGDDQDTLPPHDRIENFDTVHSVSIGPRMLNELIAFGMTTSAGTSEFGPELLALRYIGEPEEIQLINKVHQELDTLAEVTDNYVGGQDD